MRNVPLYPVVAPSHSQERTEVGASINFDDVYASHIGDVERWSRRLCGPGEDVEDFIHEVFLVVHRRLPEWRGEAKITTWLFAICDRIDRKRRRRRRLRRLTAPWDQVRMGRIPSGDPSPLERMERRESARRLYQALDRLDDKYRTPLILFELEGMTGESVAELTGTSLATVWVRLHRGREKLLAAMSRDLREGAR
jgi:RNA polymerase sigma-70 factor, ECF subfamily